MHRKSGAEAASLAAKAARQAARVYEAVLKGPETAPAGVDVKLREFKQVLPWYRVKDLATFASHFGNRGSAVGDIAGALATEVVRRLHETPAPVAGERGKGSVNAGHNTITIGATYAYAIRIAYAFSKLKPQLPEYAVVYDAVADTLRQDAWRPSRFQAVLVGTAFAQADVHLTDGLPAVLRPVLRELRQEASAAELRMDELRYLMQACAKLPPPGLEVEDVEALADCTQRLAPSVDFASAANLAVSWLCLQVPVAAKRAHIGALRAACSSLLGQRPSNPAYPLPRGGLAPALATLLAREEAQAEPPLTPPVLSVIVRGLLQVSKGLRSERVDDHGTLNCADLVSIARLAAEFCEANGRTEARAESSRRNLPGWAAQALSYAVFRSRWPPGRQTDPDALLALLQLLRRFIPIPEHDPLFYAWAAKQLVIAHQADRVDQVALEAAMQDVVPHLSVAARNELIHALTQSNGAVAAAATTA
eukprot:CAMPEP_0195143440 /NCGR_PEP_ID=MMETSP0448-20130528/166360_1 /TAXON_ID=66468 /ORGANISM="Heterocapsa triquestra, Strain CCMP 448" /LENGTH=477 /DNA_ID=CAMNT_0040181875 /DNA_START=42 /DNA_END=1472 /DNA_ORIENTATION=+